MQLAASMDRWTHPALHKVVPLDPMLMDGLEAMGNSAGGTWTAQPEQQQLGLWGEIISSGLDFIGKSKELDLQKDQLKAQLAAAQEMKAAAALKLEAAKIDREAMQIQAVANTKAQQVSTAGFGLDVGKLILPIAAAGGVLLFMLLRKR